jgi:hypothetical protein
VSRRRPWRQPEAGDGRGGRSRRWSWRGRFPAVALLLRGQPAQGGASAIAAVFWFLAGAACIRAYARVCCCLAKLVVACLLVERNSTVRVQEIIYCGSFSLIWSDACVN